MVNPEERGHNRNPSNWGHRTPLQGDTRQHHSSTPHQSGGRNPTGNRRSNAPVTAIAFTLTTGRYLISDISAQRIVRALREIENDHPDALPVAAMLEGDLAAEVGDVELRANEREAVLRALDEALGQEPLSEELYALRDGLIKELH